MFPIVGAVLLLPAFCAHPSAAAFFCRANFLLSVVDVEWPAFVQLCTFHVACRGPSSTMDVMSVMLSESRKVAITHFMHLKS